MSWWKWRKRLGGFTTSHPEEIRQELSYNLIRTHLHEQAMVNNQGVKMGIVNGMDAIMRMLRRTYTRQQRARLPRDAKDGPTNPGLTKRPAEDMEVTPTDEEKGFNPFLNQG